MYISNSKATTNIERLRLSKWIRPSVQHKRQKNNGRQTETKNKGNKWKTVTKMLDITPTLTENCGKLLKRWLDHITCLLRKLYAGQEATVRTGHGTMDWFQIRKGVHQGCISSPCLFNLYAEYIMRNAGLEEAQAEIKIARRNTNNLR